MHIATTHRNPTKTAFVALACAVAAVSASSSAARILGADGRRTVSQEERQQYSAVGIVTVTAGGHVLGGTGSLVNDQVTVLTAFHNVFHDGKTGPIGQVKAPMRMMGFLVGDRLTPYRVKSIRAFNRDYEGFVLADENDLAVLTLEEPVVGAQPLLLSTPGRERAGQNLERVTLVAYAGKTKKVTECSFHERQASYPRSADVLIHDCDSEGVASGAPMLDGGNAIVAIHLGGSPRGLKVPGQPFNARSNFNIARRITPAVQRFAARRD
jgi:V8-like Glu-specific endopeptidase